MLPMEDTKNPDNQLGIIRDIHTLCLLACTLWHGSTYNPPQRPKALCYCMHPSTSPDAGITNPSLKVHHVRSNALQRHNRVLQAIHPLLLSPHLSATLVQSSPDRHRRHCRLHRRHLHLHNYLPMHTH